MAQDILSGSPESDLRKRWALMQMQAAGDTSPVSHPLQAVARALQGAMGGYLAGKSAEEDKAAGAALFDSLPGLGGEAKPPMASSAPMGNVPIAGGDMNMPRGFRNNNPLNIEAGQFTQSQPGFAGSDGRFAKFTSPNEGLGAANKLLDIYQNKHGLNTVSGIIGRWSPSNDGNNVNAYAANVANKLGIGPNDPIPPELRPQLIAAMAQHENGQPLPQSYQVAALGGGVSGPSAAPPQGVQVAQAGGQNPAMQGRSPTPIPAEVQSTIKKLAADPRTRGQAWQLYLQYAKPVDPKYSKLDDETLFNERDGTTRPAGPGYRSLVDPAERAKFGIPAEDKRPYQVRGGKLINPPAETRLSIDQRGEAAFDTAAAKHQAERFDKLVTGGMDAKAMTADLGALKDIGSRITTGKTAELTAALGPYAEALGVKIDGLDDLQAYKSIVAKLAPRMRVVGSGATSDYEMRQFLEALPGLGKTPGGNEMISTTLEALQSHKEQAAEIASRAMNKEITPREADKMLRELPDPLTAWKAAKKTQTLKPGSAPTGGKTKSGIQWSVE